jgi:BolA protein
MSDRVETIRRRLEETLAPAHLEIIDDSLAHAGHAGTLASGGGHFYATIVAEAFADKNSVQRHQMVYRALGELMKTEIHALSIKAFTPLEYQQQEANQ